MQDTTDSPR